MTDKEVQFRNWFKRWQKIFNFSELEDNIGLSKRSIYKDLNGYQPMKEGDWERIEKRLYTLMFTIRGN